VNVRRAYRALGQFHRGLGLPAAGATAATAATPTATAARTAAATTTAASAAAASLAPTAAARTTAALPGTAALTAPAARTTRRANAHRGGGAVIRLLARRAEGIQRSYGNESQHYNQEGVLGSVLSRLLFPEALEEHQHGTTIDSAGTDV
jgi:hypothetical protein